LVVFAESRYEIPIAAGGGMNCFSDETVSSSFTR
jgi:hypothetical protein